MKSYLKILVPALLLLFMSLSSYGTHVKAGEIVAERVGGLTYRITLTVYTYKDNNAGWSITDGDREVVRLRFGDGTYIDPLPEQYSESMNATTDVFVFETLHTFPGPGTYKVNFQEENRNDNIRNINNGNSVSFPFYLETIIAISPSIGESSTPQLLVPPIDEAAVGRVYIHNPGAYDPDGDSLSYKLVTPLQGENTTVPDYSYPEGLSLDAVTGDLVWDAPTEEGLYNFAFIIEEWRNGRRIGTVLRDMQVNVVESENNPPELEIPNDTCIQAGTAINEVIYATDPDDDDIILYSYGEPYTTTNLPRAEFDEESQNANPASAWFRWNTGINHIRNNPYQVVFRAEDQYQGQVRLVDIDTWEIKVIGSAPQIISATASEGNISVSWEEYAGPEGTILKLYRRRCDSGVVNFDPCYDASPELSGFELVSDLPLSATSYNDRTDLENGSYYCYVIVAQLPQNKGFSGVSEQACAYFGGNEPLLTKVSVIETDTANGRVRVEWEFPETFDSTLTPPPYSYDVYRDSGEGYRLITTVEDSAFYTDSLLNTFDIQYTYRIRFHAGDTSKDIEPGTTIFLEASSLTNGVNLFWEHNTPWNKSGYYTYIHKMNDEGEYDLYDSVLYNAEGAQRVQLYDSAGYIDENVTIGDTTCYFVESRGEYCVGGITNPLINYSQEVCLVPRDTRTPCPPVLSLDPVNCNINDVENHLNWENLSDDECNRDIASYNIYYSPHEGQEMYLLDSTSDTTYVDIDSTSLAGCYYVTALDHFGQESEPGNIVCTDICVNYELPNLITPNGDDANDTFTPLPEVQGVEKVVFNVYNRWGARVYSSDDNIYLEWDGTDSGGSELAAGIYYYSAEVLYNRRLHEEDQQETIKGWVQVVR